MSNFEVSYSVNGGAEVVETFTETLASGKTAEYSFTGTADMSTVEAYYTIVASVNLDGDEDAENDSYEIEIQHLNPYDAGVTAMISPTSGVGLTTAEQVTVEITNFGGATLTDFVITYEMNGTVVSETVAGPLEGNSTMQYTFTQTADLANPGTYSFTCYTTVDGDADPSNDSASVEVISSTCAPSMNCSVGDGLSLFQLLDIDNPSGCEGYGNFTDQMTNVEQGGTHDVTMTTGYGNQYVRIWIDFNDDYSYTMDELGLDDICIVAVSKGQNRNAGREQFHMRGKKSFTLPHSDQVMHYLQRLRDEAHRYAIGSHRARRTRQSFKSPLDNVPGSGAKRKKALLAHFGSARAVASAGARDLQAFDGVSEALAHTLYDWFHEKHK